MTTKNTMIISLAFAAAIVAPSFAAEDTTNAGQSGISAGSPVAEVKLPGGEEINSGTAPVRAAGQETARRKDLAEMDVIPGYRGTSVPVPGHQTMFVRTGDRIDLLVTFEALMKDGRKEKVTATIIQNGMVLHVYRPAKPEDTGVIELLCNPVEAQYIALSAMQGSLNIIVRAPGDTAMTAMEMSSFRKLFK